MSKLINRVVRVGAMALVEPNDINLLKEKLTITSTGATVFTLKLYKEHKDSNLLYVPRAVVSKSKVEIKPNPEWYLKNKFKSNIELREKQEPLVKSYLEAINSYSPYGGVIDVPTAVGKTVMAIFIAYQLQLRTLIIVPTTTLLKQWKKEILKFTDCKESDIGIIKQNRCEIKGKKFVIGMIHSLSMKDYQDYVYHSFGFIVFDENHKLHAEVFSRVAGRFNSLYRLGLSATQDSKHGTEKAFFYHLGGIVAQTKERANIPTIYMLPYDNIDSHHNGCFGRYGKFKGKMIPSKYLNKLELSKNRIEFLGKSIHKLYEEGYNILALSDRISILENIKNYLVYSKVDEKDIGLFCGKKEEKGRRVELATYGMGGIGYDRVDITALVFCTPRADIRQAIGRLRQDGVVIDVVDTRSNIITGWSYKRLKFYNSIKCRLINKTV